MFVAVVSIDVGGGGGALIIFVIFLLLSYLFPKYSANFAEALYFESNDPVTSYFSEPQYHLKASITQVKPDQICSLFTI